GKDVRPPIYFWARRWFLRALGLTYLIAFASLWVQMDGLVGSNGVSPLNQFLPAVYERFGPTAYSLLFTLCWVDSSNGFLHFPSAGDTPAATVATTQSRQQEPPVSRAGLFLLKFLLFKLMLMSGVVKLTSGDDCWWNLTALDYHYWSQPLPTVFGWWADKSPEWFKHFSVAFCLVVEIIAPFFIWAPRRPRLIAAGLMIFLQIVIALTGNYCFFNLLTIAL